MDFSQKLIELWGIYQQLLPDFGLAFVLALIITPLMGILAVKIGAIDLPAHLRKRSDEGLDRRVNSRVHPRLGGVGMALGMVIALLLLGHLSNVSWGILVGIGIIITYGILDDVRDMKFKYQLLGQFLAALAVVVSGITINSIQFAGVFIDFNISSTIIEIGNLVYNFVFPADLITILWIMAMINFVNWMSGMDGLNHLVSAVASFMILLIAVDNGNLFVAMLIAAHLGANLGTAVYNYPPAYIFPGAVGEHLNGFLLGVFAILSGSKLPLALIALGIPILDALWVISTRLRLGYKNTGSFRGALKSITKADTNHLHHRLMAIGLSWKAILSVEVGITIALSAIGFALSGFRDDFVALIGSVSVLMIVIGIIHSFSRYKEKKKLIAQVMNPEPDAPASVEVIYKGSDEEEKFLY